MHAVPTSTQDDFHIPGTGLPDHLCPSGLRVLRQAKSVSDSCSCDTECLRTRSIFPFIPTTTPEHNHFDCQAWTERRGHHMITASTHGPQLVKHDEDCWTGGVTTGTVDLARSTELMFGQGHGVFDTLYNCLASRMKRPVEIVFAQRFSAGIFTVSGDEVFEHGFDGLLREAGDISCQYRSKSCQFPVS
jgi:hypothetical protein